MIKSGIIDVVYHTNASGLPFFSNMNEKKFKLLFMDIGLAKHAMQLDAETLLNEELTLINQGALSEQFVGQELLAYSNRYEDMQLFYWEREKTGATAEVDYVIHSHSNMFPIEVKSGKSGRLKSLHIFLEKKSSHFGIQFSQKNLSYKNDILSIPLYMIFELPRLLKLLT